MTEQERELDARLGRLEEQANKLEELVQQVVVEARRVAVTTRGEDGR